MNIVRDIGAVAKVPDPDCVIGHDGRTAATVNGGAIDLVSRGLGNFKSGMIVNAINAIGGSPTDFTMTTTLQESADGSTGWTDVAGTELATTGDAATVEQLSFALDQVSQRYVRIECVVAFTGGSSPNVDGAALLVLGEAQNPS